MKGWQKLICRASVVAGISFISLLIYKGYPPSTDAFYIATLNFVLSFLFFINTAFENNDFDGDGKPDCDKKKIESEVAKQLKKAGRKEILSFFKKVPNLWFP